MLPNHPNGYPPGSGNNNGNWQNQVPNQYYLSTAGNGIAPTSGPLAIRGTEDYVLSPDEERQLLRTKQMVEDLLTRSRHNKEKAELEARLSSQMDLVPMTSNAFGSGPPLLMQGPSRGGQPQQQHEMYPSTFTPSAQHPLEPLGSAAHSSTQIVEVPNTPTDQRLLQPRQIQPKQWQSFPQPQPSHLSGQGRAPPDTLGGLYPTGNRAQQQQPPNSSQSNTQPIGRPSASAPLPQSYQNFSGPSARLGIRPPSFPTTYQSTNQQSQTARNYRSSSSDALAGVAQSSSSSDRIGLPSSATSIQPTSTGSTAIPNVVAAAAAQTAPSTASHGGAGPLSISASGASSSGFHNIQQPNMIPKMHVDVRSKYPSTLGTTPAPTNNRSLSVSVPNTAASTSAIPRSHAEALQKGPILRPLEKESADSTPSPSAATTNPTPGPSEPPSGNQAHPTSTLPPGNSRTAVASGAANESSVLPPSGETAQPAKAASPVLMPVRAAPDVPVYTYFLPFGTPNSAPIFYQATQAQLDTQFSIAWEQIIKNGGNLTAEQQQLMLQNLRFVYKHICQTGVRRDDKYHFFVQSGVPRPPMASKIPTVNQTPTTTQPSPAAVSSSGPNHQLPSSQIAIPHSSAVNDAAGPMTGGPAHEGPSPNQRPSLEPVPNQAVQQITNQTPSSNYKPVDAQLASIPTSSATNRLSAPASSSISQEAIPVVESLPASLQSGPFTPNQAMSFVDILRQNNPSAQDLADSIIRELGSPRKNTRKRKFAPESDVETGQSSSEKGRQKSRLDGDPRQATGNPSASPRKDGSSMGDKSAPMASPPKSQPPPLVLTLTPGREVLPSDSTLPMVPAPLAETLPGNLPVPTQVPGPVSTEPLADSSTSLHQTTANLNAPTDVSASESLRSSLAPRATSQNFAPLNPSQESDEQRPQPNQPESHPPAQSVALTAQSTPSRPPSTKNTPNIIPPTPTQPPTPAKQPDFKQLIPPEGHPFLPSPGRTRIITPPPIIAILPASDDTHFSPSLEPASRGGDSEVDELMDDADENPKVVDVVAPVTAPTIPADAPLATNDQAVEIAETTAMLPRVRVRPKTEFWVEIPYRPDLLKKARKGPPSGLRPETISSSRTTSRSVSLSAEARASRTPSRAGSQLNVLSDKDILSDYHARQIFVPCRWKGCKIVVDSLEKLRLHITATHVPKDEQRSFDCQWRGCPAKPFETRKSLSQHVKGHISKLYPCPLENCTALLDSETSLLKHVHNTHRSNGHLCPIALPTQLVPPAELPTLPTGPIPVYHEYKGLVRPAVISKAKREKLSPEVLHKILGHGIAQGLPRNAPLRRLLRESLTLESASAFDEYEFLRKEDDKDLRSMLDLVDLRALKEERRRTVLGHSHPSGPNSVASSKPPSSRASGQRSPLLPLNRLEVQDGAETKVVERSRRSSTQSSEKGSVLDPIVLDDLDD